MDGKPVDFGNLIAKPAGDPCYIRAGRYAPIQFFFQQVDLGFPYAILIGAVKVVVGSVMVDSVTP